MKTIKIFFSSFFSFFFFHSYIVLFYLYYFHYLRITAEIDVRSLHGSHADLVHWRVENLRRSFARGQNDENDDEKPFAIYEGIKDSLSFHLSLYIFLFFFHPPSHLSTISLSLTRIPTVWHSGYYWHRQMPRSLCISLTHDHFCLLFLFLLTVSTFAFILFLSAYINLSILLILSFSSSPSHSTNFSIYSSNYYDARYADNWQLLVSKLTTTNIYFFFLVLLNFILFI